MGEVPASASQRKPKIFDPTTYIPFSSGKGLILLDEFHPVLRYRILGHLKSYLAFYWRPYQCISWQRCWYKQYSISFLQFRANISALMIFIASRAWFFVAQNPGIRGRKRWTRRNSGKMTTILFICTRWCVFRKEVAIQAVCGKGFSSGMFIIHKL